MCRIVAKYAGHVGNGDGCSSLCVCRSKYYLAWFCETMILVFFQSFGSREGYGMVTGS